MSFIGLCLMGGSSFAYNSWSLLVAGFSIGGLILLLALLINDKIKSRVVAIVVGLLFIAPMYLGCCLIVPITEKFTVLDGNLVENWKWKIPFVGNVVEVDKNVFVKYNCFAIKSDPPINFIQGYFWTNCEVKVLNEETFLQFIANEKNPNKKIQERADEFLANLIKESEISTENPFTKNDYERFHDI